jgi:hypothetical protein
MVQQALYRRFRVLSLATYVACFPVAGSLVAEESAQPAADVVSQTAPNGDNAAMRAELEQLKQLVLQQQARINALERQQISTVPAPATGNGGELIDLLSSSGMPSSPDAFGGSQAAPQATPQNTPQVSTIQTPQTSGSTDERVRNLERQLKRLGPIAISGDIRVREEPFFGGPQDGSQDRARARVRARINFLADLGQQFQAGLTLASGDVYDPVSTNSTLGVFYTRKPVAIDMAYVSYKPEQFKPLTLTAGKFRYPWVNTELTWDKDLNPEGAAETLNFPLENIPVLKRVAIIGFQLPFAEVTPYTTSKNIVQAMTYGTQLQTNWQLGSHVLLSAYVGYYDYQNADAIAVALATARKTNPTTPWSGVLPLNSPSASQNSITTTTANNVVTINGKSYPTGVTTVANAQYGSRFGLLDTIARLDWDTGHHKYPVTFIGDFVQNTRACANVSSIQPKPDNTATLVYTQTTNFPCDPDQRTGYWLEGRVGRLSQKRDWQVGYARIFIEREAVLANFNYSEMRQGTNVTQHRVDAFYMFQNNVQLGFTALIGKPLGLQGLNQPWLTRLQFDAIYIF